MKVSNQKNSLARPQSPTLSDGSHPKRPHLGSDDYDPDEKFEKVRRIDSPTETSPRLGMQFSPQIGTLSLSGKGSPTANPNKRSVSPKALYPPSIQKFLNGKSTLTIEEAIDKLKTPSNKTHKGQLEKMKMLGAFQKQEVASNVAFRKAYTNSPTSVSPARSTSPVGSPMVISPRHENMFQESENITFTFDDEGDSAMQGGLLGAMGKMNFPKQNVDNWLSNMGIQGGNNGMFQQQQQDNGRSHGNMQMNQGNNNNNNNNFGGNNNNQRSAPFNQFGQQQPNNNKQYQSLTPQALAFLNSQSQDTGNYRDRDRGAQYDDDEPRDRTNSFLRLPRDLAAPADTNYRSLADTQLNAIQSIMRATRAISPTEPNRGVMQQFQKRNSNPESIMNNHGHGSMQMQQPLFENRPSAFNQNMMQDFNTGFNGGMQQHHQYSHQQYNNNNGMQQQQGMFSMQHNQQQHMDNAYNNQNNMMKKEYAPQQQQQQQYNSGYGGYGQQVNNNMGMQGHESKNYHDQMAWNMPNHQINGDPEAFLFEKNETEDFDLNIIPSDLNFMPNRQMEELADPNDNHLIVPDPTGMDQFFNNPHGMFRFNQ